MLKTAIVLAGGNGIRLMPLTQDIPKPMVKVAGKPMIEWIVEWLAENGIKKVVIGVDYKKEALYEHFKNYKNKEIEIVFNDHGGATGTGDAFRKAIENHKVTDDDFIAMNGDELTDLSLKSLQGFHKLHKPTVSLVACPLPSPYGVLDIGDNFTITAFREKPILTSHLINSGIYIFNKRIIPLLPEKGNIEQTTFVDLAKNGQLKAYQHFGFWRTLDNLKDLEELEGKYKEFFEGR